MVTAEKAKALLALHGKVRSQPLSDWKGPFPLPPVVEAFYKDVGPANITIKTPGNPYFLPCLANLWKFQRGYGYNGLSGEPVEGWNADWVVVADQGGDSFIFDLSSGRVLHATHGEDEWDTSPLFPDLNMMAACLAQIGVILSEARSTGKQKENMPSPDFHELAQARLLDLVDSEQQAKRILKTFRWD